MSFYRKYRPRVFAELDNASVRDTLLSFLKKNKSDLPHAFLFCGTRGTGKTTAARLIAKLFTCEHPKKNGEPCGACEACVGIAEGNYIDVLEIDAASNTGVDNIRDLRDKIMLSPSRGKWKVYIIDEVHMLSTGAFNALLKTLEEPPAHAVFILATTDQHKVPATIQSRCMTVLFKRPTLPEIAGVLTRISSAENIVISPDAIDMIANIADGSFRDAVKLLEQISLSGVNVTPKEVENVLSMSDAATITQFADAALTKQAKTALLLLHTTVTEGKDCKSLLVQVLEELERRLTAQVTGVAETQWNLSDLTELIKKLSAAYGEMRYTVIPQLPIEIAVVEFCETDNAPRRQPSTTLKQPEPGIIRTQLPAQRNRAVHNTPQPVIRPEPPKEATIAQISTGLITLEKLQEYWKDIIDAMKTVNHSAAGMLRSTRPKAVANGIVTIEAFYSFHQERLSDYKVKESVAVTLKKLFGESVSVEIVLGKKIAGKEQYAESI